MEAQKFRILEVVLSVACPKCGIYNLHEVHKGRHKDFGCGKCQNLFQMNEEVLRFAEKIVD